MSDEKRTLRDFSAVERLTSVRADLHKMLLEEVRESAPDPKDGYQPRDARPQVVSAIAKAIAAVDTAATLTLEAQKFERPTSKR
jgi:hypothetical protein